LPKTKPTLALQILDALQNSRTGLDKRQLSRQISVSPAHKSAFKSALVELLNAGKIEKNDQRKFRLSGQLPPVLVVDFFGRDEDGELLACSDGSESTDTVIRLAPGNASTGPNSIGVGDRALVRLQPGQDGYQARVIRKLHAEDTATMLGVAQRDRAGWKVQSISRKNKTTMILRSKDNEKLTAGDLIRVAPVRGRIHGLQQVKLLETIGSMDQPKAASVLALAENDIKEGFSPEELEQAETAKPQKLGQRTDLRDIPLITIDPEDARDFDDAIHAHQDNDPKNPDGWVVWVAIADVAAFVPSGSPLDSGARKRGNSVYLPDRVVPMLPEQLSTDLCSLRPQTDRACMAVRMVFDAKGYKKGHNFVRGLMRSHARLTYEQAQAAIDGNSDTITKKLLKPVLQPLWSAFHALQIARTSREPLEIETDERKIRIKENGEVESITAKQRLDVHRLVEAFMVSANVCAAETLEQKNQPLIYRVHAPPDQSKIYALADFLTSIGSKWNKGQRASPARFNQLLRKVADTDMQQMVNQIVLRTQMRAVYDTKNIGHFGLSLDSYAHFTSPIRRYADLTVHRALIRACNLGEDGADDREQSELASIAEQITKTERTAMAAERDAASRYIAAHLADQVQAIFNARVSGVTKFGLFLTLDETGADGLVPIRSLGQEYFNYDEQAHTLIGRESGGRYRLGMAVKVRLLEANPLTGGLIFEMLSQPTAGAKPKRQVSRGTQGFKRNKKFKRRK